MPSFVHFYFVKNSHNMDSGLSCQKPFQIFSHMWDSVPIHKKMQRYAWPKLFKQKRCNPAIPIPDDWSVRGYLIL